MKTNFRAIPLISGCALSLGLGITLPVLAQEVPAPVAPAPAPTTPIAPAPVVPAAGDTAVGDTAPGTPNADVVTPGTVPPTAIPSGGLLDPQNLTPQTLEQLAASVPEPSVPPAVFPPRFGDVTETANQAVAPLTLEEALVLALQNNPQRAATRFALQAAEARIGSARSQGGLQVGLSGDAGLTGNFGSSGSGGGGGGGISVGSSGRFNDSASIGVNATIPIYTGGRVSAATRAARSAVQAQAAQTLQVEQELVLNATNSYLDVLRAEQLLQVAESDLAVSRERQRVSRVRYEAGASARLDVFTANTTLASSLQRRISAVNAVGAAKANLNNLLGREANAPLRVEPIQQLSLQVGLPPAVAGGTFTPETGGGTREQLRATALQQNPTIDVATANVNTAEANVDVARAQRRPSLGASLGALIRNPASLLGRFAVTLGLSVAQTLFDSGRSRSQINEARALAEQTRSQFDLQVLGVDNQIEQSLYAIDTAQGTLQASEAAVEEARAALAAAVLGYGAGARTALDVNDAQLALLNTQTNLVNSRFNLASSQAQLAAAVGVMTQEGQSAYRLALQQERTNTKSATSREIAQRNQQRRRQLGAD